MPGGPVTETFTADATAGPAARQYLLAGLLASGRCGRRLESAWPNGKPAYRCRYGYTSATGPDHGRPKSAPTATPLPSPPAGTAETHDNSSRKEVQQLPKLILGGGITPFGVRGQPRLTTGTRGKGPADGSIAWVSGRSAVRPGSWGLLGYGLLAADLAVVLMASPVAVVRTGVQPE